MMWRIGGKILLKILLPLFMLIGALNYGLYLRGVDPMEIWREIAKSTLAAIESKSSKAMTTLSNFDIDLRSPNAPENLTTVYSWKDSQGTVHYSSTKPTGVQVHEQIFNPDTNLVQSFKTPIKPKEKPETLNAAEQQQSSPSTNGLTLPEGKELPNIKAMDELKKLDAILKKRQETLDKY